MSAAKAGISYCIFLLNIFQNTLILFSNHEELFRLGHLCPWSSMVPTGTGNQRKPGKCEGIFQSGKSQGILSRLEKSGNFTQNTGKLEKNYTGKLKRILEKSGKFVSQ